MQEMNNIRKLSLQNGDTLSFLGEKRILEVVREERKNGKVKCVMGRMIMRLPYDANYAYRLQVLEKWYRREAKLLLQEKAEEFAKLLNVSFTAIYIKDQKSCWGSCSGKGNLNFNWRIVMAPEPVCDYIVIHELCHLIHMNHSESFWALVERMCPPYKQYKKWLKENAYSLYFLEAASSDYEN